MSAKASFWAWEQVIDHAPTKLVLLALADNANEHGCCYPGINYLSRKTALCGRTIQRSIRNLEALNLVSSFHRKRRNNSHSSNAYQLLIGEVKFEKSGVSHSHQGGVLPVTPLNPLKQRQRFRTKSKAQADLPVPSVPLPFDCPKRWLDATHKGGIR